MADRTVSVQLRADVSGFLARMRAASAAARRLGDDLERTSERANISYERMRGGADRLERQLRRLAETQREQASGQRETSESARRSSEETERHTRSTERNTRAAQNNVRGLTASRTALVSLVAAGVGVVPAIVSAGVAFTAFGAVAAPSIIKVVTAQKDLAASWTSLSGQQRTSALLVRGLTTEYKALARSYEPQALTAFNTVMGTARSLLPRLGDVVNATGGDVQRLIGRFAAFTEERVGGEFLTWAGRRAPEALDVLGTTALTAGDTVLDLVQDLEPLAISMLQLTNGALSVVNGIAGINPAFAQLLITGLLLRAPLLGIASGFTSMRTRMAATAAATRGMSFGWRALNFAAAAGPILYIAAGAALGFLAIKMFTAKDSTDRLVSSLKIAREGAGNNISVYQRQADFLNNQYNRAINKTSDGLEQTGDSSSYMSTESKKLGEAAQQVRNQLNNLTTNADSLASQFGITREQATRLADAAGVNLATQVDKSGKLTAAAAAKIRQYQQAVQLANDPTRMIALALADAGNKALQMKDRVTALTTALDAVFNPSLAAYQATTQLKEGYRTLSEQLSKAKGRLDGNTASSLQARAAFAQQLQSVSALAQAELRRTGSMEVARAAVARQLPILYALAGANRGARNQVDALARSFGVNTTATYVSRNAFLANAAAMGIGKARALALWQEYQRLTGRTNLGTVSLNTYIGRVQQSANALRTQAGVTGRGSSAQAVYNAKVRDALPVLYALAGRNAGAKAQVDALARATGNATGKTNTSKAAFMSAAHAMGIAKDRANQLWRELQKIRSRDARINVYAEGAWKHSNIFRAAGGPIPRSLAMGSGGATEDDVPIWASAGEHMWTKREVDAVGGHGAMHRLRGAAARGELRGYAHGGEIGPRSDGAPGYARGGAVLRGRRVNFARGAASSAVSGPILSGWNMFWTDIATWMRENLGGGPALSWAKAQAGKPYIWGGVGPRGYDCSGFMSAIVNVIRRRNPHSRLFTTHSFKGGAPAGFVRGLKSPFTVGVDHSGVGHMAGTLGGRVDVESGGGPQGSRVYVGAGASGTSDFPHRFGLRMARGGPVDDRLAERALRRGDRDDVALAASLGLIGDPSSRISPANPALPGYAAGGWVRGRPGERMPLIGHGGEFMVNRGQASANGPLLEALNSGLGEALLRRSVRGGLARGGDGASLGGGAGAVVINVDLHNHGVIGSQIELDNWLAGSMDRLRRQHRLPRT